MRRLRRMGKLLCRIQRFLHQAWTAGVQRQIATDGIGAKDRTYSIHCDSDDWAGSDYKCDFGRGWHGSENLVESSASADSHYLARGTSIDRWLLPAELGNGALCQYQQVFA